MILRELRKVRINVKDNRDGDDEGNGVEVGTNELLDDIPV